MGHEQFRHAHYTLQVILGTVFWSFYFLNVLIFKFKYFQGTCKKYLVKSLPLSPAPQRWKLLAVACNRRFQKKSTPVYGLV